MRSGCTQVVSVAATTLVLWRGYKKGWVMLFGNLVSLPEPKEGVCFYGMQGQPLREPKHRK